MKRKIIKALSFVFVFLFLVSAFPFSASAGVTDATENIATSDVMTDLERFGINITQYQKDLDSKHCRMLNFLEYGYSYYSVASDYGLYVYMWNPAGRVIETNGKNYIQMAILNSYGEKTKEFTKYPLEYVSHSTQEGYEHLFYKFRVGGIGGIQGYLEKAMRRYDISGVELHFQGDNNATDSGVSAVYSFTGYMSYRGADTSVRNTLKQYVSDRVTAELELHGTTWKTSTSDKGQDYAYEIFSVYFSVPNDIIDDYGDKNDATKGLIQVDGEFTEHKVNGIVTDNVDAYNLVYSGLGKAPEKTDFRFRTSYLDQILDDVSGYYPVRYNFNGVTLCTGQEDLPNIDGVYYSERFTNSTLLSQNQFLAAFYDLYEELGGYRTSGVDDGRIAGKQSYTIKDTDDWGASIASYATNHDELYSFLAGRGNLTDASKDYGSINAIEVVTSDEVSSALKDEYISESLFVDQNDVSALRDFVNSETLKNNTVYLMRFAVCDYYNSPIVFYEKGGSPFPEDGEHYFFEKTIFLDFDVMKFTWENEYEQKTVIPVVASPIDIVGSITPSTNPSIMGEVADNITNIFNNAEDLTETIGKFKTIIILIAGLLVLALVVWILNKLGIFKGIGSIFGFIERRVDKHRERKEHKEDRAVLKEDVAIKRSANQREQEKHDSNSTIREYREDVKRDRVSDKAFEEFIETTNKERGSKKKGNKK